MPAGEWSGKETGRGRDGAWLARDVKIPIADYKAIAAQFNPQQFKADEWVAFAKSVGMKYIVITAKHVMALRCLNPMRQILMYLTQRS